MIRIEIVVEKVRAVVSNVNVKSIPPVIKQFRDFEIGQVKL